MICFFAVSCEWNRRRVNNTFKKNFLTVMRHITVPTQTGFTSNNGLIFRRIFWVNNTFKKNFDGVAKYILQTPMTICCETSYLPHLSVRLSLPQRTLICNSQIIICCGLIYKKIMKLFVYCQWLFESPNFSFWSPGTLFREIWMNWNETVFFNKFRILWYWNYYFHSKVWSQDFVLSNIKKCEPRVQTFFLLFF